MDLHSKLKENKRLFDSKDIEETEYNKHHKLIIKEWMNNSSHSTTTSELKHSRGKCQQREWLLLLSYVQSLAHPRQCNK